VGGAERRDLARAVVGQRQALPAPIVGIGLPGHQVGHDRTVDQFYDGVVLQLELFGDVADGRPGIRSVPAADREQQLVLVRRQPGVPGGLRGESQEDPQGVAEPGEGSVVPVGQLGGYRRIVSLDDIADAAGGGLAAPHRTQRSSKISISPP
jgi:hypothetical protein